MKRSPSPGRRHLTTPEPDDRTVSPASFYGGSKNTTNTTAGSSHTKYHPPSTNPSPLKSSPLNTSVSEEEDVPNLIDVDALADANDSGWPEYISSANQASGTDSNFSLVSNVPINGRDEQEERDWWDSVLRSQQQRPGPGLLPSGLDWAIRDSFGSNLFDLELDERYIEELSSQTTPEDTQSASSPTIPPSAEFSRPSLAQLAVIKPHPDALYSPITNSWIIIQIKEGPLPAANHDSGRHPPLPDKIRRTAPPGNCGHGGNLTHHFHLYTSLGTGEMLNPPYKPNPELRNSEESQDNDVGDITLDVYACCQCSLYIMVSKPIPGILPCDWLRSIYEDKKEHPALGMSGPQTIISSFDVLLKAVENSVWKGERRSLSMTGKAFQKLGASSVVFRVFSRLRYTIEGLERGLISPPDLYGTSALVRGNRAWLLRAWLEISCFCAHLRHMHASVDPPSTSTKPVAARLLPAYSSIREQIGMQTTSTLALSISEGSDMSHWKELGLHHSYFTSDLVEFAYRAQCRCDPAGTPQYLQSVVTIKSSLPPTLSQHDLALGSLIAVEYSRGRWLVTQIETSAELLGFGKDRDLKLEWGDEIEDEFLLSAWKDAMRRAWDDPTTSKQRRSELTTAAAVLAEQRGSHKIVQELRAFNPDMDPDQAYRVLEVPKDVEEGMLLMVYQLRVEERPHQLERMKEALLVISEFRNSSRLRVYLETGVDAGDRAGTPHPVDWPRGLNQLGNTCYLNSLLQYFYTIADLREAIRELGSSPVQKLNPEALAQIRVGGRLISHREITRSRQFTLQLAGLFKDLESSADAAVTPSLELAKLALVTSKDEDEDSEIGRTGTDSSNSTDATLVEEPSASRAVDDQSTDIRSVLGKRDRVDEGKSSRVDPAIGTSSIQSADQSVMPPPLPPRKKPVSSDSVMMFGRQHDVAECMDNCLFQIEAALLKVEGKDDMNSDPRVVKSLFYGKSRQRVLPMDDEPKRSSSCHVKEDIFSHLSINVSDGTLDLYDGLADYFSDTVEFQGKQARMEVDLLELPPILQIQLQRVKFDRKTGQAFKAQSYVKFEESLVMDRFMEQADLSKKTLSQTLQAEIRRSRERIQSLEAGEHLSFTSHLETTLSYLSQLPSDYPREDVVAFLGEEKEKLRATIQALGEQITRCKSQLEDLWSTESRMAYELSSVFIHRGSSPSWGHYFFYSRHLPDKPDSWFKMNDSQVTAVSKEEVLADSTTSTANAYLLVYAKKGSGVIHTVNRSDSKTNPI